MKSNSSDPTAREVALSIARQTTATLLEALDEPVCLVDSKGRLVLGNTEGRRIASSLGDARQFLRTLEHHTSATERATCTWNGRKFDWTVRPYDAAGPGYRLVCFHDRTQRENLARQLTHAGRLMAVGELIAGVAHELNNPLASIGCATDLLRTRPNDPNRARDLLERVRQEGGRVRALVTRLLSFARGGTGERVPVSLNDIVTDALAVVRPELLRGGVEAELVMDLGLDPILGDPIELQQIVVNLLLNAHHAMETMQGQRVVRLSTGTDTKTHNAWLAIEDSGDGVAPGLQDRIFESFFTTKVEGKGTGLGLPLSRRIARSHGGDVTYEGPGGRFVLRLPVTHLRPVPGATPAPASPDGFQEEPVRSTERKARVLVVDDEENLVELVRELVTYMGYDAVPAGSAKEALAILETGRFDAVMTDMRMPGMDGADLYREIVRNQPELKDKVVFMTGDTVNPDTASFLRSGGLPHIGKPFRLADLEAVLTNVLA